MLRIVILSLLALVVAMLVMRLLMRQSPRLRARVAGIMRSPFVRQILIGVVLRIIRLLIFRR
ncbi:MAG: hypothetical protein EBT94_03900 [Alphaproteobacteria bacterium]|nr:hypothetical protein [Alphaproteobacteria bacterium]